ncbi:2-C-methyl-D-erythritol 4-phosphate cytidylyltransferase [Rubripirellula lacrimiformis]|uniref:2-C-methyl-D-erythritol 4-phosphate cytidylyltransferase n=1 Tax=Rubripirellula lacrimiformis TaxID=1930273 RepID=A0A517NG96_9BACT|nr:2-C-methyl-D-erythritol 4-phosphate cytidylyltransferase [Rubripirellula lacrimiformis]QDT06152.1 2-C-methyl-D-erythritol 4-phosphate cytidylyltransferase [Rubripirellula lacrimiformis]
MHDPSHQPPTIGAIAVVMPAAGSGQRFGSAQNKLFAMLAGKPLWYRSAAALRAQTLVGRIVMPVSAADRVVFQNQFAGLVAELGIELVGGGDERSDSVRAGMMVLVDDPQVRWIAVHDAARPLVTDSDLTAVFDVAAQTGAAILGMPVPGTIKRAVGENEATARTQTVDRRDLYVALTPQVFSTGLLKQAYQKHNGRPATDDAELVERIGHAVAIVPGRSDNLKITYPEDLLVAEAILAGRTKITADNDPSERT